MYETYAERKVAAFIQDRRGPNRAESLWSFAAAGRWFETVHERRDHS